MSSPDAAGAKSREFLLRRLHSLSGIVPIGVFLIVHLSVNSLVAFSGHDYYQKAVNRIHGLEPFLVPVEILGIFVPIIFHVIIGLKITYRAKPNVGHYWHWCNLRYTLQRITGLIVLVFLVVHVCHMHWLGDYVPMVGGSMFDPHDATATTAYAMQEHRWWVLPVYAIGICSACYHFATGVWTFLINWGVTVGRRAQDRAGYLCTAMGILLAIIGLVAEFKFLSHPAARPRKDEAPVTLRPGDSLGCALEGLWPPSTSREGQV